jgi:uracil-DNA glycosylase
MGFCYPGTARNGGDKPPRQECAALWHERLIARLSRVELTLLIGQYAQRSYLGSRAKSSLTETVAAFSEYGPKLIPLPHPSWRSAAWMKDNPWFEQSVLPQLREAVRSLWTHSDRQQQ